MRQRGRKSADNLATPIVDGSPPRLDPPSTLADRERTLFVEIVDACAPTHFHSSDLPLLIRYVEACVLADEAAEHLRNEGAVIKGKPSPWLTVQEKSVRALVALSLRLRLAPQSRVDPKTLARAQSLPFVKPWEKHAQ
jgi:phage terminase small subunit